MARVPSLEDLLLEVSHGLGLARPQSKKIHRFKDLSLPIAQHHDLVEELVDGIAAALSLDEPACRYAFHGLADWANFNKLIELNTWTGAANERQVLWHLLAYVYVPGFARRLAFWSFAGVQADRLIDAGMPGGDFWFLPSWEKGTGEYRTPIRKVADWLLDLLGDQSLEDRIGSLGQGKDVVRKVQTWRLEGRIPKSNNAIEKLFAEGEELQFRGAFDPDLTGGLSANFDAAIQFIVERRLNPSALAGEIPMSEALIESLLHGGRDPEEREALIRLLLVRYGKPKMSIVRQRFRVARLAQDGYQRLVKFLCPGVDPSGADGQKNKVVQLIALFQTVYNLTIQSCLNGDKEEEQDRWFESKLSPLDKADLLMSIVPSVPGNVRYQYVAERLNHRFSELEPDSPLEDLIATPELMLKVQRRRASSLRTQTAEEESCASVLEQMRRGSPWRAIQTVESFAVIRRILGSDGLPARIRQMVLQRMSELAQTDRQRVEVIVAETHWALADRTKESGSSVQAQVEEALGQAEPFLNLAPEWKPQVFNLLARHCVMQGQFEEALEWFTSAFNESLKWGVGQFVGELARDAFAVDLVLHGFDPEKQEHFYRQMIAFGFFEETVPPIEDAAPAIEEYFWSNLYRPYGDSDRRRQGAKDSMADVAERGWLLAIEGNSEKFQHWLKESRPALRKQEKVTLRKNSVLLYWFKVAMPYEGALKTNCELLNFRMRFEAAVSALIETYPHQAMMVDFKKQTPLILAADHGWVRLVEALLPHSDMNAQDYLGRTALHAAAARRSEKSVSILLVGDPDVSLVTKDEKHSVLHTAVRVGCVECVRKIVDEFPGLLYQENADGLTPASLARNSASNIDELNTLLVSNNRKQVCHSDFSSIIEILESAENVVR